MSKDNTTEESRSFREFFENRVKEREIEVKKIANALEQALCIIDECDDDEIMNIARVMYCCGVRFLDK